MTRIIGICASPFKDGKTATILSVALDAIRAEDPNIKIRTIFLPNNFPRHDGRRDEEKYNLDTRLAMLPKTGGLRSAVNALLGSDGAIFATPVRGFGPEPRMMDLFDWLFTTTDYPEYPMEDKVAGFMSVCEEDGAQSANAQMMSSATHLGFMTPGFCTHFWNKNSLKSEGNWQVDGVPEVGIKLLELVKATQHMRDDV